MGLQYRLQRGAFEARSEWVLRMPPYADPPVPAGEARLTPRLRDEALHRGTDQSLSAVAADTRASGERTDSGTSVAEFRMLLLCRASRCLASSSAL